MKIKLKNGRSFESMEDLENDRNFHCCDSCKHLLPRFMEMAKCSDCCKDTDFWEESEIESEG